MLYLADSIGSSLAPKVLGSYECELHSALNRLLSEHAYKRILDVGAADGYYAVGLARKIPDAHVFAFDTSARARALCQRLAQLNGVNDRVTVESKCTHEMLQLTLIRKALVIVDCEGCESDLIDPSKVPALVAADLIVEMHDFIVPGVSTTILERFSSTHWIEVVDSSDRSHTDWPGLDSLSVTDRVAALDEGRPTKMQWAVLTARAPTLEPNPNSAR